MHIPDNFEEFEKIRSIDSLLIWTRIKNIKNNFQAVKSTYFDFVSEVSFRANKEWTLKRRKKFSTEKEQVLFLSEFAKDFKRRVLEELTQFMFNDIWYLRAETELIVATFHFGFISEFVDRDLSWEENILNKVKPLVLRMKIPSKSNLKKYNLNAEVKKMLGVLIEGFSNAEKLISRITISQSLLEMEHNLIKKHETTQISENEFEYFKNQYQDPSVSKKLDQTYRNLFRLREELTKLTQACSPRR